MTDATKNAYFATITSQAIYRSVEIIESFQHSYLAERHELTTCRAMNMTAQRHISFHSIELVTRIK